MTAQISDTVVFRDEKFSIAGMNGQGLFNPGDFGLEPYGVCSACWRGYFCRYAVRNDGLYLSKLNVWQEERRFPEINGVNPVREELWGDAYSDINLKMTYTGGMLLAKDFIQEMYVHMGFHRTWCYEIIFELIFEHGELQSETDQSGRMRHIREMLGDKAVGPPSIEPDDLMKWIAESFSLDYRL